MITHKAETLHDADEVETWIDAVGDELDAACAKAKVGYMLILLSPKEDDPKVMHSHHISNVRGTELPYILESLAEQIDAAVQLGKY